MKTAAKTKILLAKPERKIFSGADQNGEADLVQHLQALARETQFLELRSPSDLLINPNGMVRGVYRFTWPALTQLCQALVPGLSKAVADLLGVGQSPNSKRFASPELALRTLNDVIKLRFRLLEDRRLVTNSRTRMIEGIVGQRYELFRHIDLYYRLRNFLPSLGVPIAFHEAILHGRHMLLRFRTEKPLFTVPSPLGPNEPFYGGFHLANSEVGDSAVHACAILIRNWGDLTAVDPHLSQNRMLHIQMKNFDQRFNKMLESMVVRAEAVKGMRERILLMMEHVLGFNGDKVNNDARIKVISRKLNKILGPKLTRLCIARALSNGSYRNEDVTGAPWPEISRAYSRRTLFDLFNAIMHMAKTQTPLGQERAEKAAFGILTGEVEIR